MNAFSRFFAIATVIALGLAFSLEVSAHHMPNHQNVAPGNTGELTQGCNLDAPVQERIKNCIPPS